MVVTNAPILGQSVYFHPPPKLHVIAIFSSV